MSNKREVVCYRRERCDITEEHELLNDFFNAVAWYNAWEHLLNNRTVEPMWSWDEHEEITDVVKGSSDLVQEIAAELEREQQ